MARIEPLDVVETKVSKTGDTITGSLVITATNAANTVPLTVNQQDTGGTNNVNIVSAGTGTSLYVDSNGTGSGIDIDAENTANHGILVTCDVVTTGSIASFITNASNTSVRNCVMIKNDNVLATGAVALAIQQDSSADGLFIDQNGNGVALHIDNDGTGNSITVEGTTTADFAIAKSGSILVPTTITAPGTTGNQTINKVAGRVNIAAAGTTVTVTNSLVTANSIIFAVAATADATARVTNVVAGAGSFIINTVAVTAETAFNFIIVG